MSYDTRATPWMFLQDLNTVLLGFAQLAIGCSNLTSKSFTQKIYYRALGARYLVQTPSEVSHYGICDSPDGEMIIDKG